jgi:outer membrane murein-binding lipoprotein Lpp
MNKLWLLLIIPIILSLACVSSDDGTGGNSLATQIATLTAKDASLQSSIDSTRLELSQKASKSEIDDVNRKINNLPQSGGSTPADMATKAIVDQKIADAISALKADQAWIKGSTYTTPAGTTAGEFGELVDTNGDLELWLEKVGGDADTEVITTSKGSTSKGNFDFVVVNKDTASSHSFRITMTFMPQTSVITSPTTATADNGLIFTVSPDVGTTALADISLKSNDRRVSKADNESFRVIVNIPQSSSTDGMTDWDINYDIVDKE